MKKIFVGLLIFASLFSIATLSYADYVIYDDSWKFYPDGYMGSSNGSSLTFDASYPDTPAQGTKCTKITYDRNEESWAGIICYSLGEGIDLNNFKKFSFKARAAENNTKVSFWMGSGDDSCGEHKIIPQPSILSTGWQEFTLDLAEEDMSNVKTLLGFVIGNNETISNPVTFYIDDVRYTGLNIIDLVALTGFHKGEIDLTWTAPTGEGAVIEYLVRYSESPIETQEDFNNATVYVQQPIWSPEIPGTKEKRTLSLNPGTIYYIAVEAKDVGNQGLLSNTMGNCAMARAQVIGISIEGAYDFGEIPVGEDAISTNSFLIKNIGNEILTCLLNLKNPSGWTAVQTEPVGHNQYILNVMFNSTKPGSFNNSQHALSTIPVECGTSGGKFAGDEDGVALSPGEVTHLWVEFKAPQTTSVGASQAISICVSAQSP